MRPDQCAHEHETEQKIEIIASSFEKSFIKYHVAAALCGGMNGFPIH